VILSRPVIAARGAVTGAVVAALVVSLLFVPRLVGPGDDGWRDLGLFALLLLLSPVVAFVGGLVVAWLLRLPRPWAVALGGPLAGYAVLWAYLEVTGGRTAFVAGGAALIIVVYAGVAVLMAPLPWAAPRPALVRAGVAAGLALLALAAGLVAGVRDDQDRIDEFDGVGVPLVHPDVPGFVPVAATVFGPDHQRYLYIRLARGVDEPGNTFDTRVFPAATTGELTCASARELWNATTTEPFAAFPCRQVSPTRWAYTGGTGLTLVLEARKGALAQWAAPAELISARTLAEAPLLEVTAAELARV
jgi:hypothetical protein